MAIKFKDAPKASKPRKHKDFIDELAASEAEAEEIRNHIRVVFTAPAPVKPWVMLGISRSAWYRRNQTSHLPEQPKKAEPPPPKTTWRRGRRIAGEAHLVIENQKPWLALGMSRRTWYRRRQKGEL